MTRVRIHDIEFTPARDEDRAKGIRGWFSLKVGNDWGFDGICLRRTTSGDHIITFPARRSAGGAEYAYVKPLDQDLHAIVQGAIFEYLERRS